ncbi:MAG: hypothetical protein JWO36_3695 [Myxococcales bacterium]|nr:hypothetical protein [Myxococcales bacterium]
MIKMLAIVALLCGPALADTPRVSSQQPITILLQIKSGNDIRAHEIVLVEHVCGRSVEKLPDHQDEIKICAESDTAAGVKLSIDWWSRSNDAEYRSESTTVVIRGSKFELGHGGSMMLNVAVH